MRYKYIFFDVANTLLFKPNLFDNIGLMLKKYNINIDINFLKERHKLLCENYIFPHKTNAEFYYEFNYKLLSTLGIKPTRELAIEIYSVCRYLKWDKFSDTQILNQIDIPKGIISNWDLTLKDKLNSLINVKFDHIIVSEEINIRKPNEGIFQYALQTIGFKDSSVLYIGDSIIQDYIPAMEAGITPFLIDRDNVYPYFNGNIIKSLNELPGLII